MEIISKQDGPRREDVEAKRHIRQNWGTIQKLADQISGGSYSASKKKKPAPKPSGLIISYSDAKTTSTDEPKPRLRISLNGRVTLMESNSALQLEFLGQIKGPIGAYRFILATKDNGFISPINDELYERICDLDQMLISDEFSEDDLSLELNRRLELG